MSTVKQLLMLLPLLILAAVAWIAYQLNAHPSLDPYQAYFVDQAKDPEAQLYVQYFGTSTVLVTDGETSIMTDGFFTRPGLLTMLFGDMQPDEAIVRAALANADVQNLAAVIPVHSHHDHALDAPEVAKQTGAKLVGSASTASIGRGWGLDEQQILVPEPGQPLEFGKFTVILVPNKHVAVSESQAELTGIGQSIDSPLVFPAKLADFKEGGSFSVFIAHPAGNVLVNGSAGYQPDALRGLQADTVFLGVAGLGNQDQTYQQEYFKHTLEAVQGKRVIPIHWDDFNHPASEPLRPHSIFVTDLYEDMSTLMDKVSENEQLELVFLGNGAGLNL